MIILSDKNGKRKVELYKASETDYLGEDSEILEALISPVTLEVILSNKSVNNLNHLLNIKVLPYTDAKYTWEIFNKVFKIGVDDLKVDNGDIS